MIGGSAVIRIQVTGDVATMLADTCTGLVVTPIARPPWGTDVVVDAPADLFEPMRHAALRAAARGDMLPATDILPAATVDSARTVGLDRRVGTLAVGKCGRLVHDLASPRRSGHDLARRALAG